MVPKNSILNKNSEDRLSALISSSEYGTGYNLALRDLELRGAGNVLGKEQSGHINNIGYDLYNSLLKSAVDTLKKGNDLDLGFFLQNIIDIKINARIPDSYIGDLSLKLQIYLQIAKIRTLEELKKFVEEIVDRFGKIPIELQNLIQITKLKIISYINTIISIKGNEEKVIITFDYSLSDMKGYINKKVKCNFSI
jgi:transcription-repair coupling factor (superfamily II helicase)